MTQKKSKITAKNLYTAFETIYTGIDFYESISGMLEIANFADHLNSSHKLRDSRNTSIISRKSNESLFSNENELLPAKRDNFVSRFTGHRMTNDLKPTKHMSKSIDFVRNSYQINLILTRLLVGKGLLNKVYYLIERVLIGTDNIPLCKYHSSFR